MADRFELFRLSLTPPAQVSLFAPDPYPTREEYLRTVFGKDYQFDHYGSAFHYVVVAEASLPGQIVARLGRVVVTEENLPPEQGLKDTSHSGWLACLFILDPADGEDGQKISFEVNERIGRPLSMLKTLVKIINDGDFGIETPYYIEVQPLFDAGSFWEFAKENEGDITSLTFSLVAPNGPWSVATTLKDELKGWRDEVGAKEVVTTLRSSDGLNTGDESIVQAVNYAESGGGTIRARARRGRRFSSIEKTKTVVLDDDVLDANSLIDRVAKRIARVLGRE